MLTIRIVTCSNFDDFVQPEDDETRPHVLFRDCAIPDD